MNKLAKEILNQFLKIQQNAIDSIKFSDIRLLSIESLQSIAIELSEGID